MLDLSLSSQRTRDSTRSPRGGDSTLEHEASSDGEHVDLSGAPRGRSRAHPTSRTECSWPSLCSSHCQRQTCLGSNRFPLKHTGEGPPECPCSPLPSQVMMVHETWLAPKEVKFISPRELKHTAVNLWPCKGSGQWTQFPPSSFECIALKCNQMPSWWTR